MESIGTNIYLTKEEASEYIKDLTEILYEFCDSLVETTIKSGIPKELKDTTIFNLEKVKKIRNRLGIFKECDVKIGKYKKQPPETFADINKRFEENLKKTKKNSKNNKE